ncbi:MAG: hypothetical protein KKF56_05615 [Nanoarchaeota archaeon]|nr:hypothetical protein [Nanoarchaeota archaeon]
MINKLLKKAKEVDKISIKEEEITEVSIEDFYKMYSGDIFFCDNTFYALNKESSSEWLKARIGTSTETKSVEIPQNNDLEIIKQEITQMKSFGDENIQSIQEQINQLVKRQDEIVAVLKEYIDNKVK